MALAHLGPVARQVAAVTLCPECSQPVRQCAACALWQHVGARHLRPADCLHALRRAERRLRALILDSWSRMEAADEETVAAYREVGDRIEHLEEAIP